MSLSRITCCQLRSLIKFAVVGSRLISVQAGAHQRKNVVPKDLTSQKLPDATFTYTSRDAILYALGVGATSEDSENLKFIYENDNDFSVLPTFAVIPALDAIYGVMMSGNIAGIEANPAMILHGEQYLQLYKPLPPEGATLISSICVADILDKKSAAVIICNVETRDNSNNEKLAFNQLHLFVRGAGEFGGHRTSDRAIGAGLAAPSTPPNASVTQQTTIDQAALYRLSGDRNPLHIDPSFAAIGGFSKPILHGLCSFGFSARHVLKTYCANDVRRFKAIKVRFTNPVFPGQSIRTDMWKESNSRIILQSTVAETGKACLSNSYVDLQ